MIDKLPKMNKVEMVRSDVSGKLFKSDECEIIIIKIIKGKNEDINSYSPFGQKEKIVERVVERTPDIKEVEAKVPQLDTASQDYNRAVQIKHSIIPKHMQDLFAPPPGM
jgi:hypothetical protein